MAGPRKRGDDAAVMLDQTQLAKVVDLLDRRFGLDALLIFGSEARGAARADSDVDLAALFRSPPDGVALREGRCLFGSGSRTLAEFNAILPSRYAGLRCVRPEPEAGLVDRITCARS